MSLGWAQGSRVGAGFRRDSHLVVAAGGTPTQAAAVPVEEVAFGCAEASFSSGIQGIFSASFGEEACCYFFAPEGAHAPLPPSRF